MLKRTAHVIADNLFEAVARGLKAIRGSERAAKIPEGINAVAVIAAQPGVEHQRSLMKNHDRKQKRPPTELPTAAVIAGAQ